MLASLSLSIFALILVLVIESLLPDGAVGKVTMSA